jgi:hypothetical protein
VDAMKDPVCAGCELVAECAALDRDEEADRAFEASVEHENDNLPATA